MHKIFTRVLRLPFPIIHDEVFFIAISHASVYKGWFIILQSWKQKAKEMASRCFPIVIFNSIFYFFPHNERTPRHQVRAILLVYTGLLCSLKSAAQNK